MGQNLTVPTIRLAALLSLAPVLGCAGSWSGTLVDAKCYQAEERNVNPTDTLFNVDRDGSREIRYCAPKAKTKSFAVVPSDGPSLKLDPAGNAKAAELVRQMGRKSRLVVSVTGELSKDMLKVDSISISR
jgi:hypothetical protein